MVGWLLLIGVYWRAVRATRLAIRDHLQTAPVLVESATARRWRERSSAGPSENLLLHYCDLLRLVDLDPRDAVHLFYSALRGNRLPLVMVGRFGDAGLLQTRRALLRDDDREVLLVLEVLLGVEVDLAALLQAVLGRLHLHLDSDFLPDLLAGFDRGQRLRLVRGERGKRVQADDQQAPCEHRSLSYGLSTITSVDLMTAFTWSPTLRSIASAEVRVIAETISKLPT